MKLPLKTNEMWDLKNRTLQMHTEMAQKKEKDQEWSEAKNSRK